MGIISYQEGLDSNLDGNTPQIQRLIIIDWSVILHKAIFALKFNPGVPATYTAMSMILGTLSRIGVEPDDVVIFAMDGRHSWRKDIESAYKGNRKAHREESGIDWDHWFKEFEKLAHDLNQYTNWIFVGPIEHIEADDIAAIACRYFKEVPEIILATIDSDWEQMWAIHPGVKIFSLQTKEWKIRPDEYNVYAELAKKIHKEASDNLITVITNDEEYDKRLVCVDLTRLPEWVEKSVTDILSKPETFNKNIFPEYLPFRKKRQPGEDKPPTLQDRFDSLYNDKSKQVIYEVQIEKSLAKEARKKAKKLEVKEKAKRVKLRELKKLQKQTLILKKIKKQSSTKNKGENDGKIHQGSV